MKRSIKIITSVLFISFFIIPIFSKTDLPSFDNSRWLVAGPYENKTSNGICEGFDRDYLTDIGGEANVNLSPVQGSNGKKWSNYTVVSGKVDFISVFGLRNYAVAYAYNEFKLDYSTKAVLKVGSDDGIKIWLNGKLVLNRHIHRSLSPDDDSIAVNLNAGTNRMLVKIDQGTGEWEFSVRFRSIKEENNAFRKAKISGLKLNMSGYAVDKDQVSGYVTTEPSFYVEESVKLTLYDETHKILKVIRTPAGKIFNIEAKEMKNGLYTLQAEGSGRLNGYKSEEELVIIGDLKSMTGRYKKMADEIIKMKNLPEREFDIKATCIFLKDQLEGKTHPSLCTDERNLRALFTINEINNFIRKPSVKITGLRQRAYISEVDLTAQPYSVYVPSTYDKKKKYGLVISLHGYTGNDYDAAKTIASCKPDDFIIAGAFGRGDVGYFGIGERDVLDVIAIMKKQYNIDDDRVYITGTSMGGFGTWRLGQLYADQFAAMAPFCGWTNLDYLENLSNLPVLIVHGTADNSVPYYMDQSAYSILNNNGFDAKIELLGGVGHNVWSSWIVTDTPSGKASGPDKLLGYFRKYKRNPYPMSVNVSVGHIRHGKQYWIKLIDFFDHKNSGSLKAKITDDRHILINADNISAFKINLTHPALAKTGRVVLNINGSNVLSDAGKESITVVYSNKKRKYETLKDGKSSFVYNEGGGMADLLDKSLLIVYGTGKWGSEKKWKNIAGILSDLRENDQISIGTKYGKYKIISDKDLIILLEKNDAYARNANLILLGNSSENLFVRKIAEELPVKFDGNNILLDNEKYRNAGIIFTYKNPANKSNLICIMTMPYNYEQSDEFARMLNINMRMYNSSSDITGLVLPDIMIYKSFNRLGATGYFNYNWKEMKINKM